MTTLPRGVSPEQGLEKRQGAHMGTAVMSVRGMEQHEVQVHSQ